MKDNAIVVEFESGMERIYTIETEDEVRRVLNTLVYDFESIKELRFGNVISAGIE